MHKTKYPATKRKKIKEILHGVEIIDAYRWLEEDSEETKQWVQEQNKITRKYLNQGTTRQKLKKTFEELLNIETFGPLRPKKTRFFQYRRKPGQNHAILYYQDGLNTQRKIAIDPNKFSKDGTVALVVASPSREGKLIAYRTSKSGNDRMPIYVLNVDKKIILNDKIPPMRYSFVAWLKDNSGFYYSKWPEPGVKEDEENNYHVYFHKLGTNPGEDKALFGQGLEPKKITCMGATPDYKYLIILVNEGTKRAEVFYKNLENDSEIKPLITGIDAKFGKNNSVLELVGYEVINNKLCINTNYKAPKYRIVSFEINKPREENWKEIIPESQDTMESFKIIGDKIIVKYLKNAYSCLKIFDLKGKFLKMIEFPVMGRVQDLFGERDGNEIFFQFDSFITPPINYRYNIIKNKLEKIEQVKLNLNLENLVLKQEWFKSKDQTSVPMFIIHKRNIKLDYSNPTVLYGYGGFTVNLTPMFSHQIQPFLQKGGVFVFANIRGGGEFGEEWHKAGTLENKQNCFDDFIAAAEFLINKGYCNKEKLAIMGGSNGGLLVGACMTQRPELCKAVVCQAPVLDMLRYHKFYGAQTWIPEYGSAENKQDFEYLIKYSPYHNVKKGKKYPAVLFTTADTDTRVHPLHARKMAALMQNCNASNNPILLMTETKAGHGFGTPVSKIIEEFADKWTFIYKELGIE